MPNKLRAGLQQETGGSCLLPLLEAIVNEKSIVAKLLPLLFSLASRSSISSVVPWKHRNLAIAMKSGTKVRQNQHIWPQVKSYLPLLSNCCEDDDLPELFFFFFFSFSFSFSFFFFLFFSFSFSFFFFILSSFSCIFFKALIISNRYMSALVDYLVEQVNQIFQKCPLPENLSCSPSSSLEPPLRSFVMPQVRIRPSFIGEKTVSIFFFA